MADKCEKTVGPPIHPRLGLGSPICQREFGHEGECNPRLKPGEQFAAAPKVEEAPRMEVSIDNKLLTFSLDAKKLIESGAAAERSRILEVIRQLRGDAEIKRQRLIKRGYAGLAEADKIATLDELLERLGAQ